MADLMTSPGLDPHQHSNHATAVPPPCLLVIFGASGDLTSRKLIPALLELDREGLLPSELAVLGVSRTSYSDDTFRAFLLEHAKATSPGEFDVSAWEKFASRLTYQPADIDVPEGIAAVETRIRSLCEERRIPGNLLFYAAVAPKHFTPLIRRLGESGLAEAREGLVGFRRVIIEKPFGQDLESARQLSRDVLAVFREDQVYRIDHYLGKETVQNLLVFRFGNGVFEPLWNRRYISQVQITVAEEIGVRTRGSYYEEAGAVRDMIQNHLFQLLSLVALEPPISLAPEDVRDEKAKLLRSIERIPEEQVGERCVRGQYAAGQIGGERVPAYRSEKNVSPTSTTETYAALRLAIGNWRWAGVPFYLRTGKRLARTVSEIAIEFRPAPLLLFQKTSCGQLVSNLLVLNIQPDEGIFLRFGAKAPGPSLCVQPVDFRFSYAQAFGTRSSPAYGRLLLDAMLGDATLFPREDTVEVSWSLLAPFLARWKESHSEGLVSYPAGSWGPPEADALLAREGNRWLTQ